MPRLELDCVPPWAVFYRDGRIVAQDPARRGEHQPTAALGAPGEVRALMLQLPKALLVVVPDCGAAVTWHTTVDQPMDEAKPRRRMLVPGIQREVAGPVRLWVRDLGALLVLSDGTLEDTERVLEEVLAWRP